MAPPTPARDVRILGVVCIWLFAGLVWSLAIPPLEAPDEMAHVDMVRHIADERGYPRDPIEVDVGPVSARAWVLGLAEGRRFTEAVPPRGDRPSFDDLTTDATFDAPNQMIQHPPLGYAHLVAAEALIRALPGHAAFDLHLWWLRLATVLLGAVVPLLIARAVRWLGGSGTQQVVAALAPLLVPQLTAALGTIGNDVPLLVAGAAATAAAARLLVDRHRTGVALGFAVGIGALTKGFGLALYVLTATPLLDRPPRWRPAVTALAVAAAVGGWWWTWNLVRDGAVQTHGVPLEQLYGPPLAHGPGVADWVRQAAPLLVDRFWGAFGSFSLHIGLPRWTTLLLTVATVALTVLGAVRGGAVVRRFACAVVLLLAGSLAILAWGAIDLFTTHGQLLGVQGRYLFAAVPGLAAVVAFAATRERAAITGTLAAVAGVQLAALWQVLQGWWGAADDGIVERLRAAAGWSPAPPALVLALLLALLVAAGLCLRRRDPAGWAPERGAPSPPPASAPSA